MERMLELLAKHRTPLLTGAILFAILVAFADITVSAEMDICHLYFASIAGVAWYTSRRTSLLFAGVMGITSLLPHLLRHSWTPSMVGYFIIVTSTYLSAALVVHQFATTLRVMAHLARVDSLTGIPNARDFHGTLDSEVQRARRYARPLTVAFIDVDDFKEINDSRGHHVGDEVLAAIAGLISDRMRTQDVLGRLGGDEFGLMLPETDPDQARPMLERIGADVAARAAAEGWPVNISVGAAGVGTAPGFETTAKDLLRHADTLMYRVKGNGKGHVLVEWLAMANVPAS